MKKLLTGILATATCFACLTACGSDSGLADAAKKVGDLYTTETLSAGTDYEVVNEVTVNDKTYSVTWAVDVTSGVSVTTVDSKTFIDVDEYNPSEFAYVLTATVTDSDGKTETVTFNGVVPEMVLTPLKAAPTANGDGFKLYMKNESSNKSYYFNGKITDGVFGFTEKASEAADISIEKFGDRTEYYLTFNDEAGAKQYLGVENVFEEGAWKNVFTCKATVAGGAFHEGNGGASGEFMWSFNKTLKTFTTIVADVKSGSDENATNGKNTEFYLCANKDFTAMEAKGVPSSGKAESGAVLGFVGKFAKKA